MKENETAQAKRNKKVEEFGEYERTGKEFGEREEFRQGKERKLKNIENQEEN